MFGLRYLKDVTSLTLDEEKCIGCRMCTEVCPHAVFTMRDKRATIVDRDACMECGACQKNCPVQAITVNAGVGCAAAVLTGMLRGTEPTCDCSGDTKCC